MCIANVLQPYIGSVKFFNLYVKKKEKRKSEVKYIKSVFSPSAYGHNTRHFCTADLIVNHGYWKLLTLTCAASTTTGPS